MAGASAADVRSILQLPASSHAGQSQSQKKATTKKPEGISRELYSLIGPTPSTLAAQLSKPRLKQKPNLGGGGKVKWELRPFKNGARGDGLQLKHWVKANSDPEAEYAFAKYNVQNNWYIYSQDEYERHLEDPDWSKEETDYLFDLVREYDLRFHIIADRYEFPRSMEDIKDRYFSVCRKLIRSRPWPGDEASRAQLLSSFQFDKDREVTRKEYLASLENRTPEQIAEEEAMYIELKRLEQTERAFKKERDELLRTLLGVESGLADLNVEDDSHTSITDPRKKKKAGVAEAESPATPTAAVAQPPPRRAQSAKSIAYDALHCIQRIDPPPLTPATKASHAAATLRSQKVAYPKPAVSSKVNQVVTELGVPISRGVIMPTRDTLAQYEMLIEAATALVETKKIVDRVEQEIRVARARLDMRASASDGGVGGDGGGSGAQTPMDVDEEPGSRSQSRGQEGGTRAQSVVSTRSGRSGRSRKQSQRRSLSISSVDTSGTSTTRAGNKRQKLG